MVEMTQGGKACETSTMWKGNTYQVLFCNLATCWFHIAENAAQVRKGFRYLGCCFKSKKKPWELFPWIIQQILFINIDETDFLKCMLVCSFLGIYPGFIWNLMVRQTTAGCKLAGLIHRELTQDACLGQPQENQFFTPVCQNRKRL